jgi:hypothetical protein
LEKAGLRTGLKQHKSRRVKELHGQEESLFQHQEFPQMAADLRADTQINLLGPGLICASAHTSAQICGKLRQFISKRPTLDCTAGLTEAAYN